MARPLALDDGLAALLVVGPLAICAVLEHRRFRGDRSRRLADPTYRRLEAWQLAGLFLGLAAAWGLPASALGGPPRLWPVLGCAVGSAGVALRLWAIRRLGPLFSRELRVAAGHRVVAAGPYGLVRHPAYAGAIMIFAGIGLGLANAVSIVACTALPAAGYVERIAREEALLVERLGEPYARYAERTRRLVPGVW